MRHLLPRRGNPLYVQSLLSNEYVEIEGTVTKRSCRRWWMKGAFRSVKNTIFHIIDEL